MKKEAKKEIRWNEQYSKLRDNKLSNNILWKK